MGPGLALGGHPPDPDSLDRAAAAARHSDTAIVFTAEQMGEEHDEVRPALPGDPKTRGGKVHPGAYSIMIGSSSGDIRLRSAFPIQ